MEYRYIVMAIIYVIAWAIGLKAVIALDRVLQDHKKKRRLIKGCECGGKYKLYEPYVLRSSDTVSYRCDSCGHWVFTSPKVMRWLDRKESDNATR